MPCYYQCANCGEWHAAVASPVILFDDEGRRLIALTDKSGDTGFVDVTRLVPYYETN